MTEPTAGYAVTEKIGKLRVCLDPHDLNKAVLRKHYSIPTTEDMLSNLIGNIFIILVEKDDYWQVKLIKESSLLCTCNTPWGPYRVKCLLCRIKSSNKCSSNTTVTYSETSKLFTPLQMT